MVERNSLLLVTLLLGFFGNTSTAEETAVGKALYAQSCAACHGVKLEGGKTQSLIDSIWQFGQKRSYVFRNIKYGIADFAMPAYEVALTDKQIDQVIDYILAMEKEIGTPKPPLPQALHTLDYQVKVEVVADGLDVPWAIDFLDKRRALVTEREGRLRTVVDGKLLPQPVSGTPEVVAEGQGGLMDVAVDPEYAENGWIYLAYSHALPKREGKGRPLTMTRLVRGHIRENAWVDQQVLYEAAPAFYGSTRHHYGCRIVFDPEGYLYFSVGERGIGRHAQDLSRPTGKVHRIHRDGSIPKGNPFVGVEAALPTIFTYGNRNPQGLAVHPQTGRIWESEHGPMGGDELNRLSPGRNYGWPEVTFGRNYDGNIISELSDRAGIDAPALYWKPSIAVCGIDFVRGDRFPKWRNQLLVGALKYEEVRLLDIRGDRVIHQEIILKNAGRVRDVACGPDGAVYVVLNGPGTVLRLTPADPHGVFSSL